jgi:hypothetical protein
MREPCPLCLGRLHKRHPVSKRWELCECAYNASVPQAIRRHEEDLPESAKDLKTLPLHSMLIGGDFQTFRYRAWKTLVELLREKPTFRCLYTDAYRLVEVYFARDTDYQTIRELASAPFDLAIVTLGISDVPNKLVGPLLIQFFTYRMENDLPTWVYIQNPSRLRETYSSELGDLLLPLVVKETGRAIDPRLIT